ncbi:MAG: DUF5011 domain-containing protein, partial [Alphaproteobacteria bacterium]|nr:DUF5011 domain-containing protein [Alphaproteobacteria bacterium]
MAPGWPALAALILVASLAYGGDALATSHGMSTFELVNDAELIVKEGPYTDYGATCTDSDGGAVDVVDNLVGRDQMEAGVPGVYTHVYECTRDGSTDVLNRTIIFHDTERPRLIKLFEEPVLHPRDEIYTFNHAECYDDLDGSSIKHVAPPQYINKIGDVAVGYQCIDKSGNSFSKGVLVRVHDGTPPEIVLGGDNPQVRTRPVAHFAACMGTAYPDEDTWYGDLPLTYQIIPPYRGEPGRYVQLYSCQIEGARLTAERIMLIDDRVKPVITLIGEERLEHPLGVPYTDAGATCHDEIEGPLEPFVHYEPNVNLRFPEEQIYRCRDSSGNLAQKERFVEIIRDEVPPEVTLNGAERITLEVMMDKYEELGATCNDSFDPITTLDIRGTVDDTVVGTYPVIYECSDRSNNKKIKTRTVEVVDSFKPLIWLNGPEELTIEAVIQPYVEEGARCLDAVDGDRLVFIDRDMDDRVPGEYEIRYRCSDESGNKQSVNRTVTIVDTTDPVIAPEPPPLSIQRGSSYVEEDRLDTPSCTDLVDDSPDFTNNASLVDTLVTGPYRVLFECVDEYGNRDEAVRLVEVVDDDAPVLDLSSPSLVYLMPGGQHRPTITCTDIGDISDRIRPNSTRSSGGSNPVITAPVEETFRVKYSCMDIDGNKARQEPVITVTADGTKPALPEIRDRDVVVGGTFVHGVACAQDGGSPVTGPFLRITDSDGMTVERVDTSEVGTFMIEYTCRDLSMNFRTSQPQTVSVVDVTAPVLSGNSPSPAYVMSGPLYASYEGYAMTCVDDERPADDQIRFDPPLDSLAEMPATKPHSVTIYCPDQYGNTAGNRTVQIVVDSKKPDVSNFKARTIKINSVFSNNQKCMQDEGSPVIRKPELVFRDLNLNIIDRVDTSDVSFYWVQYICKDLAGNTKKTDSKRLRVLDKVPPIIRLNGPDEITIYAQVEKYVEQGATCVDNLDGIIEVTRTGRVRDKIPNIYELKYKCRDTSFNPASVGRTVTVLSKSPPVISGDSPSPAYVMSGTDYTSYEGYALTCADEGVLTNDQISFDPPLETLEERPANMPHVVTIYCPDQFGLTADNRTVEIVVDRTRPLLEVPPNRNVEIGSDSGVEDVMCEQDEGSPVVSEPDLSITNSSGAQVPEVDTSSPGTFEVVYTCRDLAENTADSAAQTVTVADMTAPVLDGDAPSPAYVMSGPDYASYEGYTLTCTDDGQAANDQIRFDPPLDSLAEMPAIRPHNVTIYCPDQYDNTAGNKTVQIVVDNTDPGVSNFKGATLKIDSTFSTKQKCKQDEGSPIIRKPELVFRDLTLSIIERIDTSAVTSFWVQYTCKDLAGNKATSDAQPIRIRDKVPPDIRLNGPEEVTIDALVEEYVEEGATCIDALDGSREVTRTGIINDEIPDVYELTYECKDRSNNKASVARTVTVADRSPPVITPVGGTEFRLGIGSSYTDPGATCDDRFEGDITHRMNVSDHEIDSSAPGTHAVEYVCKDSANNVAEKVTRTVSVVDDLRLVVGATGFVDAEEGLPSATCTGAGDPRRIEGVVKPPFDPERQFTFEDRGVAHASNFTCTDGLTYLVTNSTKFTHANAHPVISIPGYEGDDLGESDSSKLRNLRVVGSAYADDAAVCYHYTFGEVGPAASQFNVTSPITPDTKSGIYPATYACGATNSTGGKLFDVRSREIPLAARLAPEIEADDFDHRLGQAFADMGVCRGLFNNTIPHELSVTDRLGSDVEIGPATPLGTYDARYACEQDYLGGTFTAEPASAQIQVVPHGRARINVEGDGRVLERGQDNLPTALCVDVQAGTSVPVTDFVVEPEFDIAEEFTYKKRAKEHVITFSCAGSDDVPVTEAAGFTQVGARPVINVTMFTEASDGRLVSDTDAFWLRDAEYENPDARCYHHTTGEVGLAGSGPLTARTNVTEGASYGIYRVIFDCTVQSSHLGEVKESQTRHVTVAARSLPEITQSPVVEHLHGSGFVETATCKGIYDDDLDVESVIYEGSTPVGPVGPDTAPGSYDLRISCTQEYPLGDLQVQKTVMLQVADTTAPVLDGTAPSPAYVEAGPDYTSYAGYTLTCTDDGQPANDQISFEPPLASLAERPAAMP